MTDTIIRNQEIHTVLADRREIAVIWCVEDVQSVRPDLTEDQCWEVLENIKRNHDAGIGINWEVLRCVANLLYGDVAEEQSE